MSELCSLCQVVEAGPYCPQHGLLHRPFTIAGRYDVDELIGARTASFVFGAHDRTAGRAVAIKLLGAQMASAELAEIAEAQQRFFREVASWGDRGDARAVGLVDFGWDDALGVTYLVACGTGTVRPSLPEVEATLLSLDASVTASKTIWVAPGGQAATAAPAIMDGEPIALTAMKGSYRVDGELGSGGTGRVYLGQHPVIGSKVAIKVLLPEIARSSETVERFIQEARASSQIGSPNIPRYFDFGTTPDGLPYAIMEYFAGETLGERLSRGGPLSVGDTAQILEQVAGALLMAHEAGLIHRDLKPDNLLLVKPDGKTGRTQTGRTASGGPGGSGGSGPVKPAIEVKVLDFGIAKMVGNRSATRTLSGSFLGTPSHCAPEQVFGHEVDARTDVYSLGATAFQMLTGAPPFVGEVPEILSAKATEDAPDLADAGVPAAVAYTLRRMLAREPKHRAPSMAWVLEQLAGWPLPGEPGADARVRFAPGAAAHTADHRTDPDVRTDDRSDDRADDEGTGDPAMFGRADTAIVAPRKVRAPATASPARPSFARGRRRWPTALVIAGGAAALAALAALAVLFGVPLLRSTPRAAARPDVQTAPAGSATARAAAPPAVPIAVPIAVPPGVPPAVPPAPAGGPAAPTSDPAEPTTRLDGTGSDPARPPAASPPAGTASDGGSGKSTDEPSASGRGGARHPASKPPADKKPPARKPPARKPPPGDPMDVLIVDPFAHGTSSPRSDSP